MQYGSEGKYIWTQHVEMKMRHYRLTPSRVKRVIRYPARVEEGILEGAIAAMQPAGGKQYSEIWTMYVVARQRGFLADTISQHDSSRPARDSLRVGAISPGKTGRPSKSRLPLFRNRIGSKAISSFGEKGEGKKIKVITAWRYPGKAPEHDPVPQEILREIKKIL